VYVQKFIGCDGIERKIYVIGDKVFGIKRENPIYKFMREKPDHIDVSLMEREKFEVTKEIVKLANVLSAELNLKIFGFDLVRPVDKDLYYLIDLNDFPSFNGIPHVENELKDFIMNYVANL
jgi:glutathione synthase/RimK-type ligase-like ATP-grasp enzyme